jgi:hypothetical protein
MIESPALERAEIQQHALEKMPPRVREALARFVDALLARFPGEIRRVILYGSFARGEAHIELYNQLSGMTNAGKALAKQADRSTQQASPRTLKESAEHYDSLS